MNSKKEKNRHIIAVKDYSATLNSMKDGSFYLPYDKKIYIDLIENNSTKIDTTKDLKKFIRTSNMKKDEVMHSWEGYIAQGYTLVNVVYHAGTPSMERLCFNDKIKYVAALNVA